MPWAKNISKIPCSVIQGRHDVICPPHNAINLSKKLENCNIKIVEDEFKRYARVKSKNKDNWKVEILKSKLPLVYEKEIVKVLDND